MICDEILRIQILTTNFGSQIIARNQILEENRKTTIKAFEKKKLFAKNLKEYFPFLDSLYLNSLLYYKRKISYGWFQDVRKLFLNGLKHA